MITTSAELEELIDGTVGIPTIPTVLTEISAIVASPDGSAKEAAKVIEKDPAIATRALRLVNSSFYGLKNRVASINLACSILGLKVIKNLVVQASILQSFGDGESKGFDADSLWDHSIKTAVACRLLAKHANITQSLSLEDAYTSGLIHDIGKLVLIDGQAERFGEALQLSRAAEAPLAHAEVEIFGFNHAHVGGLLASRWNLPPNVQAAVMFHHTPATNAEDWSRGFLVNAANSYAHMAAKSERGWRGDVLDEDALAALGLSEEQHRQILAVTAEASME